jgi:hypothetical protein
MLVVSLVDAPAKAAESLPPLQDGRVPATLEELWGNYNPRVEPIEAEIVKEWSVDHAVVRYVRYTIGTFKGKKSRMLAYYAFPRGGKELPAILHIHGAARSSGSRPPTTSTPTWTTWLGTGATCPTIRCGSASRRTWTTGIPTNRPSAQLLWFEQHLKGVFQMPQTPRHAVALETLDGIPAVAVTPDGSLPVQRVDVYYSIDPHGRTRFWRDAPTVKAGNQWQAFCPVMSLDQPLFVYANVVYEMPEHYRTKASKGVATKALHVRKGV